MDAFDPLIETPVRVRSYELDSFGHVNHAVFLNYLEAARFDLLERGGFAPSELAEKGWGIHLVRVEVEYRKEARLGDRLLIQTGIAGVRNTSMTFAQRIVREDEPETLVCEARVVAVWIGPDRRPMRIPRTVREGLHLRTPRG